MDEHYRVSIQNKHWTHFLFKKSSPLHSIHICPTGTSNTFDISQNSFCNAKFLHVLDLEEEIFIGDFPEEITTLTLLGYLAIWCTTKFVPSNITKLKKLEILRILTKETFILPSGILQMESLRHVYIGKFFPHVIFRDTFLDIEPKMNIQSFLIACFTNGK